MERIKDHFSLLTGPNYIKKNVHTNINKSILNQKTVFQIPIINSFDFFLHYSWTILHLNSHTRSGVYVASTTVDTTPIPTVQWVSYAPGDPGYCVSSPRYCVISPRYCVSYPGHCVLPLWKVCLENMACRLRETGKSGISIACDWGRESVWREPFGLTPWGVWPAISSSPPEMTGQLSGGSQAVTSSFS